MADNLKAALAAVKQSLGRNIFSLSLSLCLLLFATWPANQARGSTQQSGTEVRALELGQPVERELAGGQSHAYQLALTTGQYLRVTVAPRGIEIVVTLFSLDGKTLAEAGRATGASAAQSATPGNKSEPKSVSAVAEAAGNYRLEVRALNAGAPAGRYEVKIVELREATAQERNRFAAERTLAEAFNLGSLIAADKVRAEDAADHVRRTSQMFERAVELFRAAGDRKGEGDALRLLGWLYRQIDLRRSLDYYRQALEAHRPIGERYLMAETLNGMGTIYHLLGEPQQSLDLLQQSLRLFRDLKARYGEALALHNLGLIHTELGEPAIALDYYNQALLAFRALRAPNEALCLRHIGAAYLKLGDKTKALESYNQMLALCRATGNRGQECYALDGLGQVSATLGERRQALQYFSQALEVWPPTGNRGMRAGILNRLGNIYAELGEPQQSLEYFSQALALIRAYGDRHNEADVLADLARFQRDRGDTAAARTQIEAALKIIESFRAKLGSYELRSSYFSSAQDLYEFYLDLLMRLHQAQPAAGHAAAALAVSERARARSLLELLAEAGADIRQGVDAALLERERALQQQLNDKAATQAALASGGRAEATVAAVAKEIATLSAQLQEVEAEIRARSPRYAALTQPQPLSAPEIQQQLDPQTLLLEYALGEQRSYLWAVTPDSITAYTLPARAEIEAAARRVYELLTAHSAAPKLSAAQQRARVAEAEANYPAQAAALSRMLLGPVAAQLGTKRLLIVAPGVLQYLPFGVLPVPEEEMKGRRGEGLKGRKPSPHPFRPLIANHEIINLPSASVISVLRREIAERERAPKAVAVLADPVFSSDDARVKHSLATGKEPQAGESKLSLAAAESALERAVKNVRGDSGPFSLRRLLFSRDEAEVILAVASPPATLEALDFRASRALATSQELGQYRVIHFATHGLLDSQRPELSGLVLSLVDEAGKSQDGFLRLHEIYNLRLNAELVVLSACQTGLGKEIKGEGLVGLTRGFMYAGAPRVVASLWQVDDAATAALMKRFYRGLLQEQLRPAAALRAAQLELLKRRQWQAPYYWGAFVLQGEWK
jgi:CHAT domain-containing protein/tetratricopeptide (TPR) repeat protein